MQSPLCVPRFDCPLYTDRDPNAASKIAEFDADVAAADAQEAIRQFMAGIDSSPLGVHMAPWERGAWQRRDQFSRFAIPWPG